MSFLFVHKLCDSISLSRETTTQKFSQSAVYQLSFITNYHTEKSSLISLTQYNLANFLDGTAPTVVSGQINPD
jgi:hypothetical protein